jgi:hypothetical protein
LSYEREREQGKGLTNLIDELSVDQELFSRLMGGIGPLNQSGIQSLIDGLGSEVYTLLGLDIPKRHRLWRTNSWEAGMIL